MANVYVGVTDNDWFTFLRSRPHLDEVNFWKPGGGTNFRALKSGELFLFKLHAPDNYIVGGGYFSHFSPQIPVSLAWETLGEKNGVASYEEMRRRIEHYRRKRSDLQDDYRIGCIILRDPFYLERAAWAPMPTDFNLNTVQGKTYSSDSDGGRRLISTVTTRALGRRSTVAEVTGAMYGQPREVRSRLGQGAFRLLVTDVYGRQCAVTREVVLPVLQAAHIRPVSEGGLHRVDNGLLLRSDVHTLFDRGYITIGPDHVVRVSPRLTNTYGGASYGQLDGIRITLPADRMHHPASDALAWHAEKKFMR